MRDGSTPEEDRIRVWVDRGYQGIGKDLPGATLMISLQEVQEPPDPDCRAEGAQPPGQLHPGARGALHRKAQALRAPGRPVRRDHKPIQP